jgi:hypothetical protein
MRCWHMKWVEGCKSTIREAGGGCVELQSVFESKVIVVEILLYCPGMFKSKEGLKTHIARI